MDSDGEFVIGTIHRLDNDGVSQRFTIAQPLNGRLTVAGSVIPVASRVQGD